MASIFLSYARGDAAKAARIAHALETAGHSVWWDRQLHAGSRFTAAIDEALGKADVVVVLWSRQSVESSWVQDEATVGREKGQLFPVLLEQVSPPLGFRQYQSIDLSRWSGHGRPAAMLELVAALGATTADKPAPDHGTATRRDRPERRFRRSIAAGAAVALLLAGGSAFWLLRKSGPPAVVIVGADTGDAAQSREFARQVALDLTRFHTASLETLDILDSSQSVRDADYRAEIGFNRNGTSAHADLSLIVSGRPGASWVQGINGRSDQPAALRQQAASELTSVLGCALEADRSGSKLSASNYHEFLESCSALKAEYEAINSPNLVPTFKHITQSAPNFAPAFALLALAELNEVGPNPSSEEQAMARDANVVLKRAEQLDGSLEEVIAGEALSHPADKDQWSHAFPIINRGLQLHPNSAFLLSLKSRYLRSVGRMTEDTETAREALGFDPLSVRISAQVVDSLAYSNRVQAAYDELARFEAIWPDSAVLADTRYRLDLRYGDPRQAQAKMQGMSEDAAVHDQSWQTFVAARINPSPAAVDAALQSFRSQYRHDPADFSGYLQALGTFGRVDEAFEATSNPVTVANLEASTDILFRPNMRSLRNDPRFIGLAARLGLLGYWQQSNMWPDFCYDPALSYDCNKEAAKYR